KVTAMGVALTLLGAATAFGQPPTAVSVAAAVAGIAVSGLEITANRRRSAKTRFQRREADDYRDLLTEYEEAGLIIRTPRDVGVFMSRETALLRTHAIRVEIDRRPFVLHPDIERFSLLFLARRLREAVMFNGPALGLTSDVPATANGVASLRPIRYYDFVATNLLSPYDVNEVGRQEPVLRGRDLIFDSRGRLRSLSLSRLANTVGVSALAFTRDGKLLLVCQTAGVAGSPGLIAPSGSGALEPRDIPEGWPRGLRDIVLNGALRELREECHLDPDDVEPDAEVIGYGRWVSRGAMPEFCAVALLRKTADEVRRKRIRRDERVYVGDILAVRLPSITDWAAVNPLELLPDPAHRHAASWPLAFSLACLVQHLQDESWALGAELKRRLDDRPGPVPVPGDVPRQASPPASAT
ncbi:MAG TPA: hypothetical protein VFY84_20315, partial [Jiangellales bacterium]|nr:hypothetical protein [Jiangellales bacterium]